jgi:hypothetical protein
MQRGLTRTIFGVAAAVLVAAAVVGVVRAGNDNGKEEAARPAPPPTTPPPPSLSGALLLKGYTYAPDDERRCAGIEPYRDLHPGAPVELRNEQGAVIATTALDPGILEGADPHLACRLDFVVDPLPMAASYQIRVAGRQGPAFSREELQQSDWTLQITLAKDQSTLEKNPPSLGVREE